MSEAAATPTCSMIVPLFNRSVYTRLFLFALHHVLPEDASTEVILVDNGSTDDTARVLEELAASYRVVTLPYNINFAGACNVGAEASSGRLLYFVNNDTVPLPGFLTSLVSTIDSAPNVAIVGSKLLYPDGTIQHAGLALGSNRVPTHLHWRYPRDFGPANLLREVQAVTGASLLIRRDEFEAVGGFDRAFKNSWEDFDLCLKVRRRGKRILYCPDSVLYHFESVSPGRHDNDDANWQLFLTRWYETLVPESQRTRRNGVEGSPRWVASTGAALEHSLRQERLARLSWERHARALEEANLRLQCLLEARAGKSCAVLPPTFQKPVTLVSIDVPATVEADASLPVRALLWVSPNPSPSEVGPTLLESSWRRAGGRGEPTRSPCGECPPASPEGVLAELRFPLRSPPAPGDYEVALRARFPEGREPLELWRERVRVCATYGARCEPTLPETLAAGASVRIPVLLVNTGIRAWDASGIFQLGYRWSRQHGDHRVETEHRGAVIREHVGPGEQIRLLASLSVPDEPGRYELTWDLVEEGCCWFAQRGSPTASSQIDVLPRPLPPPAVAANNLEASADAALRRLMDAKELRLRGLLAESDRERVRLEARVAELTQGVEWLKSVVASEQRSREEAIRRLEDEHRARAEALGRLEQEMLARDALARRLESLERSWPRRLRRLLRRLVSQGGSRRRSAVDPASNRGAGEPAPLAAVHGRRSPTP